MRPTNRPASGASSNDDTLDLKLDGELAALLAEHAAACTAADRTAGERTTGERTTGERVCARGADGADTQGASSPPDASPGSTLPPGGPGPFASTGPAAGPTTAPAFDTGLLDEVHTWPPSRTPVGTVQLVPVRPARDLRLITAWMNDPAVAAFWELEGPQEVTAAHLRAQLEGDGRSVPCLGLLDGVPMSYWEVYRADLDPIARYCRARPHDTGLHLLIGGVPDRGRGIGTALLRAVADLVLDMRPRCHRVLAEPDIRNVPSVAAFLGAGFRLSAEVTLPEKRAALMVRDRELRDVL